MATAKTSTQFRVNKYDLAHGLLVAVLTPVFTTTITSLNSGTFDFNWRVTTATALAAGLGYILKNFLTPSKIIVVDATKEDVKDVKSGDAEVTVTKT